MYHSISAPSDCNFLSPADRGHASKAKSAAHHETFIHRHGTVSGTVDCMISKAADGNLSYTCSSIHLHLDESEGLKTYIGR